MNVIKVGGNELDEPGYVQRLADAVASFGEPAIIVHGGGKAIGELQARLGLVVRKIDGLRVTDEPSLEVAQMVLSGAINKRIVQALVEREVQAVGLSGVDGGLLRCKKKTYGDRDLGLVGQIVAVNTRVLEVLVEDGFTPVVSPISLGVEGGVYNVNADEAAGAIALAADARKTWFISNVAAVLGPDQEPVDALDEASASQLIANGVILEGMIPKVRTALDVVASGIPEVIIANIDGLVQGKGTRFLRSNNE